MEEIFELVSSDSAVKFNDAVSAIEPSKMRDIWKVRELIFEAIKLEPRFTYRSRFLKKHTVKSIHLGGGNTFGGTSLI